jgi:hypothetical protein
LALGTRTSASEPAAPATLRTATGLVFLYNPDYGFTLGNRFHGLSAVRERLSPMGYAPPGQSTTLRIGDRFWYDHSEAGIEAGAQKLARRARSVHEAHGCRSLWVNIEGFSSANVPAEVGYDPSRDRYRANTDDLSSSRALRQEVARFRRRLVGRARQIVAQDFGIAGFEWADYNLPRKLNVRDRNILASDQRLQDEVAIFSDYVALLDGCGPQAQFIIDGGSLDALRTGRWRYAELIEWFVNGCRTRLDNFGAEARITAAIWPRLFLAGRDPRGWPTEDRLVPPGVMTELLEALVEVGVRRFVCWSGAPHDPENPAVLRAWDERWEEVAAFIAHRADIQRIG